MKVSPEKRRDWLEGLRQAGIAEADIDLRHILRAAMSADQAADWVARRASREPLSHILGDKPFWTLDLKVTPDVLTPRADTETLVETVLREIDDRHQALDIADFGTGSGAILLALLSELSNAKGLGIDISESALAVARENAHRNDLANRATFRTGNWADGIADESLDIAVSNPPYIASDVLAALDPEVRDHEPRIALDGGADGLDVYRQLVPELFRVLRPGGLMAVEIGYDQGPSVLDMARAAGFKDPQVNRDLGGQDRVVHARRPIG